MTFSFIQRLQLDILHIKQRGKPLLLGFLAMSAVFVMSACAELTQDISAEKTALVRASNTRINELQLRALSSAPDRVSGGDVLVEVDVPAGTSFSQIKLTRNGADVSSMLTQRDAAAGTMRGLISGLKEGNNRLVAKMTISPFSEAKLALKNHPISGPILSGPHLKPYECRTVESGLGQPLDEQCSAAQRVDYFYRSNTNEFKPFPSDLKTTPADLAIATTNEGKTVPYCGAG